MSYGNGIRLRYGPAPQFCIGSSVAALVEGESFWGACATVLRYWGRRRFAGRCGNRRQADLTDRRRDTWTWGCLCAAAGFLAGCVGGGFLNKRWDRTRHRLTVQCSENVQRALVERALQLLKDLQHRGMADEQAFLVHNKPLSKKLDVNALLGELKEIAGSPDLCVIGIDLAPTAKKTREKRGSTLENPQRQHQPHCSLQRVAGARISAKRKGYYSDVKAPSWLACSSLWADCIRRQW